MRVPPTIMLMFTLIHLLMFFMIIIRTIKYWVFTLIHILMSLFIIITSTCKFFVFTLIHMLMFLFYGLHGNIYMLWVYSYSCVNSFVVWSSWEHVNIVFTPIQMFLFCFLIPQRDKSSIIISQIVVNLTWHNSLFHKDWAAKTAEISSWIIITQAGWIATFHKYCCY